MSNKLLNYLLVSSVVLVGLFAGVLFTASIAISPSLALLDATNYTLVKQAQIQVLQVAMSLVTTVYSIIALILLYYSKKQNLTKVFNLTLWAFILVVIALVYSAFTDIPYNQQILKWSSDLPPMNWSDVRYKWDMANLIRTVPTVLGFILQSAALLYANKSEN